MKKVYVTPTTIVVNLRSKPRLLDNSDPTDPYKVPIGEQEGGGEGD